MTDPSENTPAHFKDKDAIGHVAEAQAQGVIASAEIHGLEIPGYISAGADAARETAIALLLIWAIIDPPFSPVASRFLPIVLKMLAVFAFGWSIWKAGRSAWLGWFRLERLHRILEQEKWEIEHHRPQERSELGALYATKGFEGKLLEDVLDVLMADDNRLLRVMIEEELGLSLASYEHPLKQGLGAFLGAVSASLVCLAAFFLYPSLGVVAGASLVIVIASAVLASHAQNRWAPAIIWNIGLGALSFGCVYFLLLYLYT